MRDKTAVILTRHVQSFFQGNRWLLEPLAARVLAHVPDGRVIDLYAGAGLFASIGATKATVDYAYTNGGFLGAINRVSLGMRF